MTTTTILLDHNINMAAFLGKVFSPMKMAVATAIGAGALIGGANINKKPVCAAATTGHLRYPASCNYPDLTKHNNVMASNLTPAVSYICFSSLYIMI